MLVSILVLRTTKSGASDWLEIYARIVFEDISPFGGSADIFVDLLNVFLSALFFKVRMAPPPVGFITFCPGFLRFMSGVTSTDLLTFQPNLLILIHCTSIGETLTWG